MAYTTIDDPSAYFQALSYSGGSGSLVRTFDGNSDLQPDWTWHKSRGQTYSHYLFDSTRGVGLYLKSDSNVGDDGTSGDTTSLTSFDSNGFTLPGGTGISDGSAPIMCWAWKANGGTTTTNSAGSNGADHESVYQANDTAGFSIVTYTSDSASGDTIIKHGLSTAPTFMIHKSRSASNIWWVYHKDLGNSGYVHLESTNANQTGSSNVWRNTAPTSSVFKVGLDSIAASNETMVAYCFAPIQGYSKFGSYTGNGSADGTFIYTGFKPAFVIVKRSNNTQSWVVWDNKRDGYNQTDKSLTPNENGAEETRSVDFLSNGFKQRQNNTATNASGDTYVYMAFAEHPFVGSDGVPATAR